MTQTVGKGKSKGMLKGRQAADKAEANATKVAEMNAAQGKASWVALDADDGTVLYAGPYTASGAARVVARRAKDGQATRVVTDAEKAQAEAHVTSDVLGGRRQGEWLTTKHVQPGTWVAQAIKGRPANGADTYRQVAEVGNDGSMRRITFTDGTSLRVGAATKVFVAPATDGFADWQAANGEHVTVTVGTDEEVVGAVAAELVPDAPVAADTAVQRLALAKAEHKALQAWIKDGENPPRPATPNLDAINAEHAAKASGTTAPKARKAPANAKPVPADHPLLRYVEPKLVGKKVPADLGLVHSTDATGLVRVHKASCKPALPALAKWPTQVYAAACCKPRTPGAEARTKYVPPSKRAATA